MKFNIHVLILFLYTFFTSANAQTTIYCDSLIAEGVAASLKGNHVKSLELLTQARSLAERKQWDERSYKAILGIGNTYYAMYDFGEALNNFFECYTIAVKKLRPEDEIAALNNIANLYTRDKKFDKAIEYYSKAYEIANEKNIDTRKGLPLMNLAYIYNQTHELKKARSHILEALNYLQGEFLIAANIVLIENDLLMGDSKTARINALALYNSTPKEEKANMGTYVWQIIAKSYEKEGNYPMAIEYATKAIELKPELTVKRDLFELLANVYSKGRSFPEALRFKDSIIELDKTLNEIKNGRLFYNNRVKFEIQNYKNQIEDNEDKLATNWKIFYSIIAFLLAVIIIILLVLRQKKIIAERNQHITELNLEKEKNHSLELEKQITDALLEQEQLKNDIEVKNRKLSAKALYLSDRNQLIEEIVTYLSKKPMLAKDPTLASHVRSLKANLRTDNEWDNFITHFEEVNHGFLTRLKSLYPQLTANDIRFIAYIYMNLSVKEIASILNITTIACKKRKERLAAKLEIPQDTDLFGYISAI